MRLGDILLNEGQSSHLIGRPAMYRDEVARGLLPEHAHSVQGHVQALIPDLRLVVFRAQLHARRYMRSAQITTNIAHLRAGRFERSQFPLPPTEEQKRIADEVDRLMSIAELS